MRTLQLHFSSLSASIFCRTAGDQPDTCTSLHMWLHTVYEVKCFAPLHIITQRMSWHSRSRFLIIVVKHEDIVSRWLHSKYALSVCTRVKRSAHRDLFLWMWSFDHCNNAFAGLEQSWQSASWVAKKLWLSTNKYSNDKIRAQRDAPGAICLAQGYFCIHGG